MSRDYFANQAVRALAFFFACVAIGLPMWVFILYPTEEALTYLNSPITWVIGIGTWLLLTVSFVITQRRAG